MEINFNGFSTLVEIEGERVSATDISLSAQENIIQFDGAYGGSMNYGTSNYFMMNSPSFYELPEISCSIGTEITYDQMNKLFFDWLLDRGKPRSVLISSGDNSNETFNYEKCCYFKSLRLSASQNSLVTANYDFYILSNSLFSNPIKNDVPKLQSKIVFDMDTKNKRPVGFWETKIDGFKLFHFDSEGKQKYSDKQVLDWSLTFSQNVIPKYYCGRIDDIEVSEPPLPDIMIGHPKMELSVNFLIDRNEFDKDVFGFVDLEKTIFSCSDLSSPESDSPSPESDSSSPESDQPSQESGSSSSEISEEKGLSLYIRDKKVCKFLYGKTNSYSPSISSQGGITFNVNYLIHQIQLIDNTTNE